MKAKKCIKCCEIKPICGFRLRKDTGKYRGTCKKCKMEYSKVYHANNSERIREQRKTYRQNNKDKIFDQKRQYRQDNAEEIADYKKQWNINNSEEILVRRKKYREGNKEKISEQKKRYRNNNKDKIAKYMRKYKYRRMKEDVGFYLRERLRTRLYNALKNNYKTGSAINDLGCSIKELMVYLESKFQSGMTWANKGKWHIDHIIPLSNFDLTDKKQLRKACHYSNLQPLWAIDNLKKGSKTS